MASFSHEKLGKTVNSAAILIQQLTPLRFVFDFQQCQPCGYEKEGIFFRAVMEAVCFSDHDLR